MSAPLLVTGMHRSGTTWVGKMLAADARQVAYISEPLNLHHRRGVMRAEVRRWYCCICEENEADFVAPFAEMLAFRYHWLHELPRLRSLHDALRMGRDAARFWRARWWKARPLLKDPFALLSVPWFVQRWKAQVVIVVRHPAAVVSSLKRLRWPFELEHLLAQPLLMERYLEDFRSEMQAYLDAPDDVIQRGALLWKMLYAVVRRYQQEGLPLSVVRHEDLSLSPLEGFRSLYAALGLQFTPLAERTIVQSTAPGNPTELSLEHRHRTRLDSRTNLKNWQKRLTPQEVERIREITAPVSGYFYDDADWH